MDERSWAHEILDQKRKRHIIKPTPHTDEIL